MVNNNNSFNLNIVATPIGNIEDISQRAINILGNSNGIICENYSSAKKIFKLLNINSNKPFFVFADINAKKDLNKALDFIKQHTNVALLTEAGTPLINDPGFEIVREIRSNKLNINIATIPGASSLTAHLAISGLPTDKFMFLGFLPKTAGRRENVIKKLADINKIEKTTFVLFESKYRILKTLTLLSKIYPTSTLSVGNELTKMYEKVYFGNPKKLLTEINNPKGEFVIHIQI